MSRRRIKPPSPALVISLIALTVALGGTAYAAHKINGGKIMNRTIGGGKLKHNALTGFQIKLSRLGTVPAAKRATHTYWAVVHNPKGPHNAVLVRASGAGVAAVEGGGAVSVGFPTSISGCLQMAARNNAGTATPKPGFAQTNTAVANPAVVIVHTRGANGGSEDADFHLLVVCR